MLRTRKNQMLVSCALFVVAATIYQALSGKPVDMLRVLIWSFAGVLLYALFSSFFGFDPYRSKLSTAASPLLRYAERYELRSGTATLATTLVVILIAKLLDQSNLVTAVVSATLAAWVYFMMRIFCGGYEPAQR
jgi:hypothetical protein